MDLVIFGIFYMYSMLINNYWYFSKIVYPIFVIASKYKCFSSRFRASLNFCQNIWTYGAAKLKKKLNKYILFKIFVKLNTLPPPAFFLFHTFTMSCSHTCNSDQMSKRQWNGHFHKSFSFCKNKVFKI